MSGYVRRVDETITARAMGYPQWLARTLDPGEEITTHDGTLVAGKFRLTDIWAIEQCGRIAGTFGGHILMYHHDKKGLVAERCGSPVDAIKRLAYLVAVDA